MVSDKYPVSFRERRENESMLINDTEKKVHEFVLTSRKNFVETLCLMTNMKIWLS